MKTFEELVKTAATCHVVATDCLESFSGLGVRVVCELFIKPLWFRERTVACAQSAKSKSGNVGARLAGDIILTQVCTRASRAKPTLIIEYLFSPGKGLRGLPDFFALGAQLWICTAQSGRGRPPRSHTRCCANLSCGRSRRNRRQACQDRYRAARFQQAQ